MARPHSILLFIAFLLQVSVSHASDSILRGPHGADDMPRFTLLNINNISMWVRDDGWSARTPQNGEAGFWFPRGVVTSIFQDGWLWGGNLHRSSTPIRVGGQFYGIGTIAGRIISPGVYESPGDSAVRIYRIRPDYETADLRQDAAELRDIPINEVTHAMVDSVRAQYASDWLEWPCDRGAPFYDGNGNSTREPDEAPGLADADQVIWFVANDHYVHNLGYFLGSPPLGMEIQTTLWGYKGDSIWGNVIFKRVRLLYKGTGFTPPDTTITDMLLSQNVDPDLGYDEDDFVGCDTVLNLAYAYNGNPSDPAYAAFGHPPPAIGYQLVQGPRVTTGNPADTATYNMRKVSGAVNLSMSSFTYLVPGYFYDYPPFTYEGTLSWYQMMRGLPPTPVGPPDPPLLVDHVTGQPIRFWQSGDPVRRTGWIDGIPNGPGSRYFQFSTGPFSMAPGDTQEVVVAIIAAMGSTHLGSVALLKQYAVTVMDGYDNLLANIPRAPETQPAGYSLLQNYPNPFNGETRIPYSIPSYQIVTLKVYDLLGKEVTTLVNGVRPRGANTAVWNSTGRASGVYFYRIQAGRYTATKKLILLR
jgi:hypothetical protein